MTGLEEGCTHTELVIPAAHEGLPVTAIGDMAFIRNTVIERVTLPDTVKIIGQFAFDACSSLKEADIGDGVEVIGAQSFYACSALEKINFPESLKEIDAYALTSTALTEVVIPDHVIRIGVAAFAKCALVTKLTLGTRSGMGFLQLLRAHYDQLPQAGEENRRLRLHRLFT